MYCIYILSLPLSVTVWVYREHTNIFFNLHTASGWVIIQGLKFNRKKTLLRSDNSITPTNPDSLLFRKRKLNEIYFVGKIVFYNQTDPENKHNFAINQTAAYTTKLLIMLQIVFIVWEVPDPVDRCEQFLVVLLRVGMVMDIQT